MLRWQGCWNQERWQWALKRSSSFGVLYGVYAGAIFGRRGSVKLPYVLKRQGACSDTFDQTPRLPAQSIISLWRWWSCAQVRGRQAHEQRQKSASIRSLKTRMHPKSLVISVYAALYCKPIERSASIFVSSGCCLLPRLVPWLPESMQRAPLSMEPLRLCLVPLWRQWAWSHLCEGANVARWWFPIFLMFTPAWGRFPIWLIFFRWVETTNQIG